jgi:hypothetical protein
MLIGEQDVDKSCGAKSSLRIVNNPSPPNGDKAAKGEIPVEEGTRLENRRSKGATDLQQNHDLNQSFRLAIFPPLDIRSLWHVRDYPFQDLIWQVVYE